MAALERELVSRRGWLSPDQYGLAYALARVTPGTNMLAFCAGAAWFVRGWPAALMAVAGATVPAAVLVVWLTYAYEVLKTNAVAAGAIAGMLASAAGMMVAAAWSLARPHLRSGKWPRALALAGASTLLSLWFFMPPIQVLGLAAVAGYFWREPKP